MHNLKNTRLGRARPILALVGGIAVLISVTGILYRSHATADLRTLSAEAAIPTVAVLTPEVAKDAGSLVLPGSLEPLNSAAIYAQTSGYIHAWSADIGDTVTKGQVLAVLDAPELEQQIAQARADYATSQAEQKLAESTSKRVVGLKDSGAVSKQAYDEALSNTDAKTAVANAAAANVKRLEALEEFTKLTAPFDGTVTSRSAQVGDLVVSGLANARPLFNISDSKTMRIYVRVPQSFAPQIRAGMTADLLLPEYPGKTFTATVTRSAGAVDNTSGSVLVELQADNKEGALLPGSYAQVKFALKTDAPSVRIPGSALLFRGDTPALVVLGDDNTVTIKPVTIGRDEGRTVEISAGLAAGDRIIDTPPDAIRTGDKVKVQETPTAAAAPVPAPAKN